MLARGSRDDVIETPFGSRLVNEYIQAQPLAPAGYTDLRLVLQKKRL